MRMELLDDPKFFQYVKKRFTYRIIHKKNKYRNKRGCGSLDYKDLSPILLSKSTNNTNNNVQSRCSCTSNFNGNNSISESKNQKWLDSKRNTNRRLPGSGLKAYWK